MTRAEANELIRANQHLINTTPEKLRVAFIYPTPSNGEEHDEVVKALIMGYSFEPILARYNDFTVNVLYGDDYNMGLALHESLEFLLSKINR